LDFLHPPPPVNLNLEKQQPGLAGLDAAASSGGSVFAAGSWQWRKGQADGAGAGGELIDRRQLDSRTGTITTTCCSCFNYRPEDQRLRLRRRNAPHPAQVRPLATSASVIGSGTATTPKSLLWLITAQTVLEVMSTP